jgi:formylglycine-generating enzyme required for sulfatase activity
LLGWRPADRFEDGTTTENGAYDVNGATSGTAVARNPINPNTGAAPTFYIPLEDEWYKAAYYSPAVKDGARGYYYDYATQSDTAPGNVIGGDPNQANYFAGGKFSVTEGPSQEPNQNYLTDVGALTASASFYGTFDQNGNVWQWNDLNGAPNFSRGLRGGYWFSGSLALQSSLFCTDTTARENNDVGFRLASLIAATRSGSEP